MKNILAEMKGMAGISLNEDEVNQAKQMSAESRLIGAFGRLLQELRFVKLDMERQPIVGCGAPRVPENEELEKTIDYNKLHKLALEKIDIVKDEINKIFEKETSKKDEEEEKDEDDEY